VPLEADSDEERKKKARGNGAASGRRLRALLFVGAGSPDPY